MTFRHTDRRNFTRKVKVIAFQKAKGKCEGCTARLALGHYTYDHKVPWELSRDSSVENCQVLCDNCDDGKTHQVDVPLSEAVQIRCRDAVTDLGSGIRVARLVFDASVRRMRSRSGRSEQPSSQTK